MVNKNKFDSLVRFYSIESFKNRVGKVLSLKSGMGETYILPNFRATLVFIFIYLSLSIGNSLFAIEPVELIKDNEKYPLGLHLEILEDEEGVLTINDIVNKNVERKWVQSKLEVPNYGYTKNVYWLHFKIRFTEIDKYYLEIAYPHLDKIEFYSYTKEGKWIQKKSGDFLPFSAREVKYRNFVFVLSPDDSFEKEYFVRFESASSMQFPMYLWSPIHFTEKKNDEMTGMGLYFGVMLVMTLYNLFIWISVKDKSYLYYVLYIIFSSIHLMNYYGISAQYIADISPDLYNLLFHYILLFANIAVLLFTFNFLQIKKNLPKYYNINKNFFLLLFTGIAVLFPFISYRSAMLINLPIYTMTCLWCLSVGFIMRKSFRPARFYLVAWSVFLIGAILSILKATAVIPVNIITEHSIQFGSALEVILLSLGLADRINELKKENVIAQQKALEAEQKSNKVKDEFLANLSHELRTPLTIVYAYSEMMAVNQDYPEEVKEYSKEIFIGATKLNDYVNDLILLTDLESDLKLQFSPANLKDLIVEVIEQNRSLIEEKEIQLELELDEKIEFDCDNILLKRAISALLKNAIVYNKQGGKVFIFTDNIDLTLNGVNFHNLQIKIIDTGIGIPKEFHRKIFEKFLRIDSALTYEVSGVGVGLYLTKKIIELHGGSISVKSELQAGAEFCITLPLRK